MRKPNKKSAAIMIAALAVVAGGGAAFAYWTAGGSGTGTAATSASTSNVTVVQTSTVTAMQPGDTAQTLSGNFNNPNNGPAYVGTVTAAIASVTKAGGAPAGTCDATDYTLAGAAMTVNAEVPAGDTRHLDRRDHQVQQQGRPTRTTARAPPSTSPTRSADPHLSIRWGNGRADRPPPICGPEGPHPQPTGRSR